MWLMQNNSFLSIVDAAETPGCLLVRARRVGDIEAVFPHADVVILVGRDYRFRAQIMRADVAKALVSAVMALDYPNFKSSVADYHLHRAYADCWSTMASLQEYAPCNETPRPGFRKHPQR
jgi:hypothetical protein